MTTDAQLRALAVKAQADDVAAKAGLLEAEAAALEGAADAFAAQATAAENQSDALAVQMQALGDQLAALQAQSAALKVQADALATQADAWLLSANALDVKLDALANQTSALGSVSDSLSLQATQLDTNVGGVSDRVAVLQGLADQLVVDTTPPPPAPRAWAGINHDTGRNPNAATLDLCLAATADLGLGMCRMGWDAVGGATVGVPFDWTARDAMVLGTIRAGLEIHAIVDPFTTVHINPRTVENFKRWFRAVLMRYGSYVKFWTLGNEPDKITGLTVAEIVSYVAAAKEVRDELGLQGQVLIGSPPVSGMFAGPGGFTETMLIALKGLVDFVDAHCYSDQIHDDVLDNLWQIMAAAGYSGVFCTLTECGMPANGTTAWSPINYPGGPALCRARWHAQFAVSSRAMGFRHVLLFDLLAHTDAGGGNWQIAAPNGSGGYTLAEPVGSTIRSAFRSLPFANGDFSQLEDGFGRWFVRQPVKSTVLRAGTVVTFPLTGGRDGFSCCRVTPGTGNTPLSVRQVAGQLVPGKAYRVKAWAAVIGGATAILRARGYDMTNGLALVEQVQTPTGAWSELTVVTPPITNPWVVVELRVTGTSGEARFSHVSVEQLDD